MGRIKDLPLDVLGVMEVPAKCHWCGKEAPTLYWDGFRFGVGQEEVVRGIRGTLCLCQGCAFSISGGLVQDLVFEGIPLEELFDEIRQKLRRTRELRAHHHAAKEK